MALVVEDGTGKADAESYISVSDADTYFSNRGNTSWTGTDAAKEQALRKATDFMTQMYRGRWKGVRVSSTQALDWPRSGAVLDGYDIDEDVVPDLVANACAELAVRSMSADLAPDQERKTEREKVGPIDVTYKDGPDYTRYRAVTNMLAPLLMAGTKLVRA